MKDIALTDKGAPVIQGGDFVVAESTEQHQRLLLISDKGEWKQFPDTGVGLTSFLDDDLKDGILRVVAKEFMADGMEVNTIIPDGNGELTIDASYE